MSILGKQPLSDAAEDALAVLRRLRDAGHIAYLAGGCVRDVLLGLAPTDFDVATDAPPDRVRSLFSNTQAVGAAFGVILVRHRQSVIEVATFRAEGKYLDGRRPSGVRFTSAEEDAQRRDFTINGLFLDPNEDRVIDFVGGQEDLRARRLRAIGNPIERFAEDHLRLLRAVRFAARFDLQIDETTAGAIRHEAGSLKRISPERIAGELRLMLQPPTRAAAWSLLWNFGLVDVIFRMITGAEDPATAAESSLVAQLPVDREVSFGLALAAATTDYRRSISTGGADLPALLDRDAVHDVVQALRKSLKISNEESEELQSVLQSARMFLIHPEPGIAKVKRFLATSAAGSTRVFLEAIATTGIHTDSIAASQARLDELSQTDVSPPALITGDDLTDAGLSPGPLFRRVLEQVYDAQLEHRISTRDQALALAIQLAKS